MGIARCVSGIILTSPFARGTPWVLLDLVMRNRCCSFCAYTARHLCAVVFTKATGHLHRFGGCASEHTEARRHCEIDMSFVFLLLFVCSQFLMAHRLRIYVLKQAARRIYGSFFLGLTRFLVSIRPSSDQDTNDATTAVGSDFGWLIGAGSDAPHPTR